MLLQQYLWFPVLLTLGGPAKRARPESPERERPRLAVQPDSYLLPQHGFPLPELGGAPRRLWTWFQPGKR